MNRPSPVFGRNGPRGRARRPTLTATIARLLAAAAAAALAAAAGAQAPARLPVVDLSAGIHLIHAELADDDASRMRGLMFRDHLEPNRGMLFVFDEAAGHCMWMRNTLIPLAVAFLDDAGAVINVEEMKARTDDSHCAARPARYALEMDAGWFRHHGVLPGARIEGVLKARRH